ncbi:odorant receptor 74a [Drosophila elegans]|uniref:odorant receptor 74a n=1 Tax=Drosophila elegans TaxID=30023 RepID=UPI0007E81715|nr:odorant receptor 74a [Drosophila elegans]
MSIRFRRYRPRLPGGELAPMPWPVSLYRLLNHIAWPLEADSGRWSVLLDRVLIFVGFLVFCEHNEVDFHYLIANRQDMDNLLTGMPTYLILVEMQIRCYQLAWHKDRFRDLLQRFYAEIYVSEEAMPQLFAGIQRQMLATRLNSTVYLLALFNFFLVPVTNVIYHRREMLYKQVYPFDNTQLQYFIPLLGLNFWVGFVITSMLFGELNVLGELMMHLNARYVQLGQDLHRSAHKLLEGRGTANIATRYRLLLTHILRRNAALRDFGQRMEEEFSFRIFVMFAFSAGLLCALFFKAFTNPWGNVAYIVWFLAKFMELLALGMLGSILLKTTDELGMMYYTADWEQVVHQSDNVGENVRLMKLVSLAIELNSRPFFMTGLKYFRVSLTTVLKIIQGAFSYFTFLNSMR